MKAMHKKWISIALHIEYFGIATHNILECRIYLALYRSVIKRTNAHSLYLDISSIT